jgi:hypothetical protein
MTDENFVGLSDAQGVDRTDALDALFSALGDHFRRLRGSSTLEDRFEASLGFVRELTEDVRILAARDREVRDDVAYVGDRERLPLGMPRLRLLEGLQVDSLDVKLCERDYLFGFGMVDLDLFRRYRQCPALIPVGGLFTTTYKLEKIRMRLDKPLACFFSKSFRLLVDGQSTLVFCSYVGSVSGKNPSVMRVVLPSGFGGEIQQKEVYVVSPNICGTCGMEGKAGKRSYHCSLCGLMGYCGVMCQRDDYRRDHNLERKDGHVRSEEVPTEGWCRHLQSRRSGGLVPMLNYDTYKAGLA